MRVRRYGSWAVCFTYGAWFGLEALGYLGDKTCESARKGAAFLLSKQREDGGWGEDFKARTRTLLPEAYSVLTAFLPCLQSCSTKEWVDSRESQAANTAWALLGLMAIDHPDPKPVERGIRVRACRGACCVLVS